LTHEAPAFEPHDDRFHFAEMSGDWWDTETSWFSFHDPDRRLGGWIYTMVRPTIGTVAGGAWVWDDSAHLPWEVLYSANYTALQLPDGADLDDISLPTGASIKVLRPGNSYALGYEDRDRLALSLRFDGVMPPEPLTAVGSTFGSATHFDQVGRVTGDVVVAGETIAIDCLAFRDRTWGRRREDRPRKAAYVTGAASDQHAFLAVTDGRTPEEPISYGFLRRDGETVSLASGNRHVERDPSNGWIARIRLSAVDRAGRTLEAIGEPVSRIIVNRHTFIDINSLVRWTVAGEEAWGEDQDMWPVPAWADRQRNLRRQASA
jgi:hypothetical protein